MTTIRAWFALLRTRLRLARVRGDRLLALTAVPSRSISAAEAARCRELAARIARASRFVPRSRCLDRAVLLVETARRESLPVRLRLGVRRDAGPFRAHAWVEDAAGEPYGDAREALAGFAPLARAPTALEFGR